MNVFVFLFILLFIFWIAKKNVDDLSQLQLILKLNQHVVKKFQIQISFCKKASNEKYNSLIQFKSKKILECVYHVITKEVEQSNLSTY